MMFLDSRNYFGVIQIRNDGNIKKKRELETLLSPWDLCGERSLEGGGWGATRVSASDRA